MLRNAPSTVLHKLLLLASRGRNLRMAIGAHLAMPLECSHYAHIHAYLWLPGHASWAPASWGVAADPVTRQSCYPQVPAYILVAPGQTLLFSAGTQLTGHIYTTHMYIYTPAGPMMGTWEGVLLATICLTGPGGHRSWDSSAECTTPTT